MEYIKNLKFSPKKKYLISQIFFKEKKIMI